MVKTTLQMKVVWLVVLGLTVLWDSISVYIGPSPTEGERKDDRKIVQNNPTRTYCKRIIPGPNLRENPIRKYLTAIWGDLSLSAT